MLTPKANPARTPRFDTNDTIFLPPKAIAKEGAPYDNLGGPLYPAIGVWGGVAVQKYAAEGHDL
ncbi:MAG: hypothetical protein AB7E05_09595 [Sphingobium sp.]